MGHVSEFAHRIIAEARDAGYDMDDMADLAAQVTRLVERERSHRVAEGGDTEFTLYPVVEVGQRVVLTGSAWADLGGLNVPALVVDIDTSDEKVGPLPVARWVSSIHGDYARGTLDPDADESWAYRLATPEEYLRAAVGK